MFQDLKNQRTHFEPDTSRSWTRLKANQSKKNFISQEKEDRSFLPSWYDKWTWLHYDEGVGSAYCIICKNVDHYNMLNDIWVENSFIETRYSNWKKYWQRFSSTWILKLSPTSCPKTDKNSKVNGGYFWKDKSNLTEVQRQNRAWLIELVNGYLYVDMDMTKILISNKSQKTLKMTLCFQNGWTEKTKTSLHQTSNTKS